MSTTKWVFGGHYRTNEFSGGLTMTRFPKPKTPGRTVQRSAAKGFIVDQQGETASPGLVWSVVQSPRGTRLFVPLNQSSFLAGYPILPRLVIAMWRSVMLHCSGVRFPPVGWRRQRVGQSCSSCTTSRRQLPQEEVSCETRR